MIASQSKHVLKKALGRTNQYSQPSRLASTITGLDAREVLDSRGNPTLEIDLMTTDGLHRASVASGASTGTHEAVELRDGDADRYDGKGVLKAMDNLVNVIGPKLMGLDPTKQAHIDEMLCDLDGTPNKARLGGNAIVGASIAVSKAGAAANGVPLYQHYANLAENPHMVLPVPSFNVLNGGVHAGNRLPFQEFMIMPIGAETFAEALRMGAETYHTLKNVIREKYGRGATNVGDEGGFAPDISTPREALDLLVEAIARAGYEDQVFISIDPASSEFYINGAYDMDFKSNKKLSEHNVLSGNDLNNLCKELIQEYPIVSLEDAFAEDDWSHFKLQTADIGDRIQIVGDDLLVTNPERIERAIGDKTVNALLLKVNQIGTISEAMEAVRLAKMAGWGVMTSHRSGETDDSYIADLTVGLSTGQIKSGAPCRGERLVKYNQLMRIEQELGDKAIYAGKDFRLPEHKFK